MKSLKQILNKKVAVFAFGRLNPPTVGHEKLIDKLISVAKSKNATPFMFVSHTQDAKKNPLSSKDKVKYIKLGMPQISKNVVYDLSIKTPFDALAHIIDKGYTDVIMIAGDDRVADFKKNIGAYVNHPDPKKSFNLNSFDVVSAGERDPDSEGVTGISASKMREFATKNDYASFKKGAPSGLSDKFARNMFDDIRKGMRLVELFEEVQRLTTSLNIPRSKMPQIQRKYIPNFLRYLKSNSINVHQRDVSVRSLKPTQNEIDMNKVRRKYEAYASQSEEIKPFIVSYDNYILDGHHQLFAVKLIDPDSYVSCYILDIKMIDLLNLAKNYSKAMYKSIKD
ncbi:hypothetical protein UFOVP410_65 [uncultured Caudovirales phage]|uniref:Cytidyltransferase-like domain-containing protein n=1 Tax=uncultured Caudovirales phage TaxID=2100421 RepID=A0A6J5M804_9CAUD|nr:hypothetical protein UFOVP410_65 [uncultured Caudovirales phage]